ncbi:CheR family methyltransferase [Kineosporia babensis]|uniref:protein-glutamate O-methyltransferase n=1 Tax=Kineosporia babensis TaxID=499548 RepID=A0A9X1NAS8_9ACTN|nr:protein-glutamate O-methyltransferase CheR [Kineosporia babensis]MCD5309861.1 protein-glutamate O-methyltransferase CheR [Kineosporia babensis]
MSIADADFTYVATLVRKISSIDLHPGKEYLVESRLTPVARRFGDRDVGALVYRLRRNDRAATEAVIDAMTTNETSWFRDQEPFDAFSKIMLPELKRIGGSSLNIWSAASSSGQEAYSLAMLMLDWLPMHPGKTVKIHGTDISPTMVARATAGRYSQMEINRGMPVKYLLRYFTQAGRDWVIKPEVRALTSFRQGNLAEPPAGLPPMDIVFLRNVLIYFDQPTKRQVLGHVRRVLRPGGFLVLGGAESTLSLDDSFERVEAGKVMIFRNGEAI